MTERKKEWKNGRKEECKKGKRKRETGEVCMKGRELVWKENSMEGK